MVTEEDSIVVGKARKGWAGVEAGAGNRELTLLIKSKEQREKRVRLLTPKAHLHLCTS